MSAAATTVELFPTPEPCRVPMTPLGSRLRVRISGNRHVEGDLIYHEKCKAGTLVVLRTPDGDQELVVPTGALEVTVPLPFGESLTA